MAKTIREVTVKYLENIGFPYDVTVPEGTELTAVEGGTGISYAVKDVALLIRLTGNTHDPHYRYCCVPDDVVDVLVQDTAPAPR
jgi:hypothetical protein